MSKQPMFRGAVRSAYGFQISPTKQMSTSNLRSSFSKWGQITGFKLLLKPYAFRRGNSEALDSSGMFKLIPTLDNALMRGANFASLYQ